MEKIFLEGKHKQLLRTLLRNRVKARHHREGKYQSAGDTDNSGFNAGGLASDGGFRTEWEGRK